MFFYYDLSFSFHNVEGYVSHILSSISHVTPSGIRCFHCTYIWTMAQFGSISSFVLTMRKGSIWNFPSGSIVIIFQSITWVASCTYRFDKKTWNTLCTFILGGSASSYATNPILANTSKGTQYLGTCLKKFPKLKALLFGFCFRYTWSLTLNSLVVLLKSS